MSQIALPLDVRPEVPQALPDVAPLEFVGGRAAAHAGFEAEGLRIGWEHARYRSTPPADHLHAGHPVRQGWEAGRAAFAGRTLAPTRAARLWLELRLQAWLRGRAFDDLMVTPRFVAQIDVQRCPVTHEALSHSPAGIEGAKDAVLMPLCESAACAAGNLVVVSRQVAQARAALSPQDMAHTVQRLAAGEVECLAGLDLQAWRRLQGLTSLATPLAHDQAAAHPLHVLPPARVRLLNPVQALQALLTLVFTGPGYARQLTDLGAFMPHGQARRAYFLFMNAMLARRLSARGAAPREHLRNAMEQAWSHPLVQQRWQALAQVLPQAQTERLVRLVVQRGAPSAPGFSWRWMDDATATEGWGFEPAQQGSWPEAARGAAPAVTLSPPADALVPGPARSRPMRRPAGGVALRDAAGRPTASILPASPQPARRRPSHGSA
jgi:hypothetical protein